MHAWLVALLVLASLYALGLALLAAAGRRDEARALARMLPDVLVLVRRLARERTLPRSRRWALWALLGYLLSPLDLVPDMLPVIGQLDDAILVVLVLRWVLGAAPPNALEAAWPGSARGLELLRAALAL